MEIGYDDNYEDLYDDANIEYVEPPVEPLMQQRENGFARYYVEKEDFDRLVDDVYADEQAPVDAVVGFGKPEPQKYCL
eukprot:c22810_g2_i1 orf=330-563(-)